ncbi:hypothetical protein MRX96_042403 [Rhipicephalus microplus]
MLQRATSAASLAIAAPPAVGCVGSASREADELSELRIACRDSELIREMVLNLNGEHRSTAVVFFSFRYASGWLPGLLTFAYSKGDRVHARLAVSRPMKRRMNEHQASHCTACEELSKLSDHHAKRNKSALSSV